jgi:SAM-dependent methyltransferase
MTDERKYFGPDVLGAGSLENLYKRLYSQHGDSPETVRYSSKESQYARFDSLIGIANLSGQRLLDFGCGLGHFSEYLIHKKIKPLKFTGVDIIPEFLEKNKQKFPNNSFILPSQIAQENYDYGIISGVFNDKSNKSRDFWKKTIIEVFKHCEKGIAFNMMSTYVEYEDKNLFYEKPEYVFSYIKRNLTPFVTLRHDFQTKENTIPFEFVIYAYKKAREME